MSKKIKEEELEDGYMRCPIKSCVEPINKIEDMVKSSFDSNVMICISCKIDGN